ncbi:MAG TPA: glycoside hydrolase family 15 protein [Sandaracinaceae bacterium]
MIVPEREPSIADYGVVGNCHSAALVSRDGFVDWLCLPSFGDPSVFAGVLDRERGGHFVLRPRDIVAIRRAYRPDTNVLCTTFRTRGGTLLLEDCMPVSGEPRRCGPDFELLRVATCTEGTVELELEHRPRFDYGRVAVPIERRGALGFFSVHRGKALVLETDDDGALHPTENGRALAGRVRLEAGQRFTASLGFAERMPLALPTLGAAARARIEECARWWRDWVGRARYEGPYPDALRRSLLALRLLVYAPSGGIVAAPTTSLPEYVGGPRNWDYRYCWLRDASLVVDALLALDYRDEAEAFLGWVLHTTRLTWPELSPVYDVMGHRHVRERVLPHLAGYRGSRPVRIGNAAALQLQLDSYGELVDAAARMAGAHRVFDRGTRRMLARLGRFVLEHWREPDRSIWEERAENRHHTFSKAMCWVALDRLVRLAERGEIRIDAERMRSERDEIRATIEREGFDARLGAYVAYFGGAEPDASLLLLGRYGYADPRSPRMRGTVAFVRRELETNGIVRRYHRHVDDGVRGDEHGFGACCFWLVSALAAQGDLGEATRLFESLLTRANDLGLYAEEIHQRTGEPFGNFPQAFTHVALVTAALDLERARGAPEREAA